MNIPEYLYRVQTPRGERKVIRLMNGKISYPFALNYIARLNKPRKVRRVK